MLQTTLKYHSRGKRDIGRVRKKRAPEPRALREEETSLKRKRISFFCI